MFARFARFASKYKALIIILWLAIAIILFAFAPDISRVGVIEDSQFLPQNTGSAQALKLLDTKFSPAVQGPAGSALIVIYDPHGLSSQDNQQARSLYDWLTSKNAPAAVSGVVSVFENDALRSTLISQDQTAMLMDIQLSVISTGDAARQAVQDIRTYVQSQFPGSQIYVTGNAGISNDLLTSIRETIDKATLVTILLVIVLLLIIYRSPVAIFVPLITIGISYLVARGIVGYAASWGVKISTLMDAYLVVMLFGIGTDYCLFMVSRFKEELLRNEHLTATVESFRHIGPVILASATTVIVALLCLVISKFSMNQTTGIALAIGVAVTLLASLTLTPALISLFGRRLLWPARFQARGPSLDGLWTRIGRQLVRHPAFFAVPIILLMVVPYLALRNINTSADMLSQMPQNLGSVTGFNILRSHFPSGEISPAYVLIESPQGSLLQTGPLKQIAATAESIQKIKGVASVEYFSAPAPELLTWSQDSRNAVNAAAQGSLSRLSFFSSLGNNLQGLAVSYPGVLKSSNFNQAVANLQQISAFAAQLQSGGTQNTAAILSEISRAGSDIAGDLQALSAEFDLQGKTPLTAWLQAEYFSEDGSIARINVVLQNDPYSPAAINTIKEIRDSVPAAIQSTPLANSSVYVGGETATQADILAVNDTDFLRVLALAIVGILIVTIILLRSLLAPLYMVVTVVFNFGATLGISTWLFLDVLKQDSITYMLPIFIFIILIAVGSDYNIFLVSRIREESHKLPLKEAISHAVANTGGVITACGIILAGTFGTLMLAPLQLVFQIGAAIAIGIIIDTFLIRALVIPSLATLAGRWSWWPSGLFKKRPY